MYYINAPVAQWIEQRPSKPLVASSILAWREDKSLPHEQLSLFLWAANDGNNTIAVFIGGDAVDVGAPEPAVDLSLNII
jgi:hypothetical protein